MIWLKAFGITLGVTLVISFAIRGLQLGRGSHRGLPAFLKGLAIGASAILSTFLWKKVLEQP